MGENQRSDKCDHIADHEFGFSRSCIGDFVVILYYISMRMAVLLLKLVPPAICGVVDSIFKWLINTSVDLVELGVRFVAWTVHHVSVGAANPRNSRQGLENLEWAMERQPLDLTCDEHSSLL